ncbi:enoyl-CoA hydratase-related protein [Acuticoccus sp. MNP-M23]|uniref:enoyl-CoA hydratase/isomerase family protein n=1 Tax=Acuticoccus sp. MNP-M23 TaxID=3072793 RepID=UPI0028157451|nr:enoyl-CoA hydratase-related protein [Acuticoccus sp. MNP-M23]WMS43058.1 enoyl-CoA hydratase-related protein [Acuticoccus sp. MNP-M23]
MVAEFDASEGGYVPHVEVDLEEEVAIATLTNPERRNAISVGMWRELEAFAAEASGDPEIRAVVFRGYGDVFSAGADISDFEAGRAGSDGARAYDDQMERACLAIEAIRQPTVVRLEGPVVGAGAALASCCDLRIASDDAFFMVPAARLGLGYDPRGVARLARTFGDATARWLLLTAGRLPATRAFASGAVHELVEQDALDETMARLIERLTDNAPLTIAAAKVALRAVADGTEPTLMDEAWRLVDLADASDDYAEGRRAFAAKRNPRFVGQ